MCSIVEDFAETRGFGRRFVLSWPFGVACRTKHTMQSQNEFDPTAPWLAHSHMYFLGALLKALVSLMASFQWRSKLLEFLGQFDPAQPNRPGHIAVRFRQHWLECVSRYTSVVWPGVLRSNKTQVRVWSLISRVVLACTPIAEKFRPAGCVIRDMVARSVKMNSSKAFRVLATLAIMSAGSSCFAQSYSSTGSSWSASWGYATVQDRSLGLATAQAMQVQSAGRTSPVYNTYNSTNTTSSVGSMNTGTTSIQITGDQNTVTAPSGADNTGCVDGSLSTSTVDGINSFPLGPIDLTVLGLDKVVKCPG